MKKEKTIAEQKGNTKPVHLQASAKLIRKKSGKILKQYPAEVGYHGSGNEKDLSPEE